MKVQQYVMAYEAEQDRLRALLPDGFVSLRPVLRINAEIRDGAGGYVELNTPVEKDNDGCFFLEEGLRLRKTERIDSHKEFCDCTFRWSFAPGDAHGVSQGKTLPAYPTECRSAYPREELTPANAAKIPCGQVLGAYTVAFDR